MKFSKKIFLEEHKHYLVTTWGLSLENISKIPIMLHCAPIKLFPKLSSEISVNTKLTLPWPYHSSAWAPSATSPYTWTWVLSTLRFRVRALTMVLRDSWLTSLSGFSLHLNCQVLLSVTTSNCEPIFPHAECPSSSPPSIIHHDFIINFCELLIDPTQCFLAIGSLNWFFPAKHNYDSMTYRPTGMYTYFYVVTPNFDCNYEAHLWLFYYVSMKSLIYTSLVASSVLVQNIQLYHSYIPSSLSQFLVFLLVTFIAYINLQKGYLLFYQFTNFQIPSKETQECQTPFLCL